jgi:anti-anti-sigma factor
VDADEPVPFTVQVEHPAWPVAVLRVRGEVDTYTEPELRQAIMNQAQRTDEWLIIDLDGVDFLGTPGWRY